MKKTILFLSILITMFVKAEAQNDAMYVYRNDGKVNAFSRSEIDSMTYSHYDADSIYHNEWQAQIVYMADCVYYIPLEVIDSIRFAAPEAKCSCPDDNHPHAIDLGLPSGTKWCCCNVGASSPEEYGGYYAWGETTEKSVYDLDTYAYYKDDSCVYIGSDISGTQYDVACVRMGAPWRMPTFEQQDELVTCCKRSWTQKNGVQGILVTGPNDAQVFLPATGHSRDESLSFAGEAGYYWTSSLYLYSSYAAYYLNFAFYGWGGGHDYRDYGRAVRPVCP